MAYTTIKVVTRQSIADLLGATEFSASASYTAGDKVLYGNKAYKFKEAHSGAWNPAASHVEELTVATLVAEGITGKADRADLDAKADLTTIAPLFDAGETYAAGDKVTYQGKFYECVSPHSGAWAAADFEERTVADFLGVSLTIAAATQDGVTVTGQRILVYEGSSAAGNPAYTAEYNGSPVTLLVPRNFRYYVCMDPTHSLTGHFGPSAATGVAASSTAVTVTYQDPDHVTVDSPQWIKDFLDSVTADTAMTDVEKAAYAKAKLIGKQVSDTSVSPNSSTEYRDPLVVADVAWYKGLDETQTPAFDSTATYAVGAVVRYGGRLYKCSTAHTGAWDADDFAELYKTPGATTFLGAEMHRKWVTALTMAFDPEESVTAVTESTVQKGFGYYGWGGTEWISGTDYAKDAFVRYNGVVYRSKNAITGSTTDPATDTANWTAKTSTPSGGDARLGLVLLTPYKDWDPAFTYPVNYTVQHDGHVYKCTTAVAEAGTPPDEDTTHWTEQTGSAITGLINGDSLPATYPSSDYQYVAIYKHALKDSTKNIFEYGYNNWKHSVVRQFFNSDAATATSPAAWWQSQHLGDVATGANTRGYLAGCSDALKAVIRPVWITTWPNSITDGPDNVSTAYETLDTFFLPSGSEMYGDVNRSGGASVEGNLSDYWKAVTGLTSPGNGNNNARKRFTLTSNPDGDNMAEGATLPTYSGSSGVYARLRSANRGYSYYTWYVNAAGYIGYNGAGGAYSLAPACVIG